jgi:dolichol-phosphate mannosyltransferase
MVIYVMLATNQATIVWYGWAIFWTSLVVTSLLLLGDRHQAKFAWATCTGVTFLFAVMVMHQIVPAYSRVQTLFGESSPLVRQLAMTQQSPIATMDHEFSEVPFYLNRNDIPNFEGHRDQRLSDFVSRHGAVTLIVNHNLAVAEILAQLPGDARLQPVVQRGSANIYQITMPPPTAKIATNPSQATLPTR